MKIKKRLKNYVWRSVILKWLYECVYLEVLFWKRRNYRVLGKDSTNRVEIPRDTYCDDLRIVFKGKNNVIKIGRGCKFYRTNQIYIQDDGNQLIIGDNVTFDQNVSIVLGEGTTCQIGDDCIFANGVRIRTCDQHFIYDDSGLRINPSKDVHIDNHVWLGASVIVMKGAEIGPGTVIGMNAMVTKHVPANCIAVGQPAKVIKSNIYWKEY